MAAYVGPGRRDGIVEESQDEVVAAPLPKRVGQNGPNGQGLPNEEDDLDVPRYIGGRQLITPLQWGALVVVFGIIIGVVTFGGAAVGLCIGITGYSESKLWLAKGAGIGGFIGLGIGCLIVFLTYLFIIKRNLNVAIQHGESREPLNNPIEP